MVANEIPLAPIHVLQNLFSGPDTVTQTLETFTGERVTAEVVCELSLTAASDNLLGVFSGVPLMYRYAVLRGRTTGRPYVRARSLYAPDRLADVVRLRLEQTSDPIGRILVDEGARFKKESLPWSAQLAQLADGDRPGADVVWNRAYRLFVDDCPAFVIYECFLVTVMALL